VSAFVRQHGATLKVAVAFVSLHRPTCEVVPGIVALQRPTFSLRSFLVSGLYCIPPFVAGHVFFQGIKKFARKLFFCLRGHFFLINPSATPQSALWLA
jgi:hypothetical protein